MPQGAIFGTLLITHHSPAQLFKSSWHKFPLLFRRYIVICSYLTHNNVTQAFDRLKTCFCSVMSANKLKLNKTEFIRFSSKKQYEKLSQSIFLAISFYAEMVRNLAVLFHCFDTDFSLPRHFQKIWKSCVQMWDLNHFGGCLTRDTAFIAANALVGSQLNYCNSLCTSLLALDLRKLQYVQNSIARIQYHQYHQVLTYHSR